MSLERKVLRDSVQQKGLSSLVICFQLDSAKLRRRGVIPNQEADIMPGLEAFVRMVPAPQGVLEHTSLMSLCSSERSRANKDSHWAQVTFGLDPCRSTLEDREWRQRPNPTDVQGSGPSLRLTVSSAPALSPPCLEVRYENKTYQSRTGIL